MLYICYAIHSKHNMTKTPKEIKEIISFDLKQRKLTHQRVAEVIGMNKGTVSNSLSGDSPISKFVAMRLSSYLGYSLRFLLTGEGQLRRPDTPLPSTEEENPSMINVYPAMLVCLYDIAKSLLHQCGEDDALAAFNFAVSGEYDLFAQMVDKLAEKYGNRISKVSGFAFCEMIKAHADKLPKLGGM